jgi:hypothetical protein
VPRLERREARVDRLRTLEMEHHRQRAVGAAAVELRDAGDDRHGAVARRRQRVGAPDRAGGERGRLRVVDRPEVRPLRERRALVAGPAR